MLLIDFLASLTYVHIEHIVKMLTDNKMSTKIVNLGTDYPLIVATALLTLNQGLSQPKCFCCLNLTRDQSLEEV